MTLAELNHDPAQAVLSQLIEPLLAYLARRLDTAMDAEDCLSETLVVLWRRRADIPGDLSNLRPYAFAVARLVLKNHRRSTQRRRSLYTALTQHIRVERSAFSSASEGVRDALESLNETDRELLTLVHWDGLTTAMAGAALGLSPAAAQKRHARALAKLRDNLDTATSHAEPFS